MDAGNGSGDSPGNDGSSLVRAPTRAAYSFADTDRAVIFPIRLRDAFRSGDVWLARSRRYGDIRNALLSTRAVAECMPVPVNPDDWLSERKSALDEGLRRLDIAARSGAISGVSSIEHGTLRIEKTEAGVPDGSGDLVLDLYRRIPDTRITDILLEVDDATRFTEAFTHLRTGAPSAARALRSPRSDAIPAGSRASSAPTAHRADGRTTPTPAGRLRGHRKVCSYDYGKEASSLGSTHWGACSGSVSSPCQPPVSSYSIVFGAIARPRVTAQSRVCTRDGVAGARNCRRRPNGPRLVLTAIFTPPELHRGWRVV